MTRANDEPTRTPDPGGLRRSDRLLLLVLALVVLLPGTFGVSLTDRDEGWYAQVSREMVASGDWLVPTYLGQPWIAKPPLLYWCVSVFYSIVGVHAWAARLVSVLAFVGVVQLLATLAAQLYNRRTALIASATFVTAGLPAIVGRMVLTDALLLLCCMGASVALWRAARHDVRWRDGLLFWACVGLGVLAKGPAIFVFVGAFALGLTTRPEWRHWLTTGRFWAAAPVAIAIAAPWYIYIAFTAGGTLAQQFVGFEILARLYSAPHGHGGPPGYYLILSLAGWLPWTPLVPGAVFDAWRLRRVERVAWPLLIWLLLPWAFLELLPSKLPHYILPCYVPLAILFGRMWDRGLDVACTKVQKAVLILWALVPIGIAGFLAGAALAWRTHAWVPGAAACAIVLAVGYARVLRLVVRNQLQPALRAAVLTLAVFYVAVGGLLHGFEPYRLSRQLANAMDAVATNARPVLVCGYDEPTMFFYLQHSAHVVTLEQARQVLHDPHRDTVLALSDAALRAAGVKSATLPAGTRFVRGFNYVKGEWVTLWVVPAAESGPGLSDNTTRPASDSTARP